MLKIADLVDDSDFPRRSKVLGALRDPAHRNDRYDVNIIIVLGMAKEGFYWIWCEGCIYRPACSYTEQLRPECLVSGRLVLQVRPCALAAR